MKKVGDFFIIEINTLPLEGRAYPFKLWLLNETNEDPLLFQPSNMPLNQARRSTLEGHLTHGFKLAVKLNQLLTYLTCLGIQPEKLKTEEQIQYCLDNIHKLLPQEDTKNIPNQDIDLNRFQNMDAIKVLQENVNQNDMMTLVKLTNIEIQAIQSEQLSSDLELTKKICQVVLTNDNMTNKIVAFAYYLAKSINSFSPLELTNLTLAAIVHQTGMTHVDRRLSYLPRISYNDDQNKVYSKYAFLSQHLIRISKSNISPVVFQIINDHTERPNGSGFPLNKLSAEIHPMALILAAASDLIQFSSGKISGFPEPLKQTIITLRETKKVDGINTDYGDQVLSILNRLDLDQIDNNLEKDENNYSATLIENTNKAA